MRRKVGLKVAALSFVGLLGITACTTPPLHKAAAAGSVPTIATLLDQNPRSIADRDNFGGTALHVAAAYGHRGAVKLLVEMGADVNDNANNLRVTPLHLAAGSGHKDVVELLLLNRANVHAKNKFGQTPLVVADCRRQTAVAALLREHVSKAENLALAQGKERDRPAPC